jgi:chitin disaccharide deacetylase
MYIIINADDFGLSEKVNSTILTLHRSGIISSTTLMAKSKSFNSAVEISKDNPGLGVGVHLCLDGPFNMDDHYKTIINKDSDEFYNNHQIIKKIKKLSVNKSEIYREYCLQVEKVLDHGVPVTHLDHHHHLHLYFPVLNTMIRVARKYKIPYIRSQRILLPYTGNFLNSWYRNAHQAYLNLRLKSIDGYFDPGIRKDSNVESHLARLKRLLEIRMHAVEIVLHPSEPDDVETTFFMRPEVINILNSHKIINYRDL